MKFIAIPKLLSICGLGHQGLNFMARIDFLVDRPDLRHGKQFGLVSFFLLSVSLRSRFLAGFAYSRLFSLALSIWPHFPDYFYVTRPPDFSNPIKFLPLFLF